jgi:O-antigen/teichoic acid export membrane protein
MLQDIKKTIQQSAIYGLSRVSSKIIAFILLPLYSANFSISEYGIIVRIEILWQILWSIFLFGLESGVVRWYSMIEDEYQKRRYYFTVTLFLFAINAVFTIIMFYSSGIFSNLIFETASYSKLVFVASLIASTEALSFLVFLLFRIHEKPLLYSVFSVLISIVNLFLQYYFIIYTNIKLEGVFYSKVISPGLITLLLLPYFLKHLRIGFEKDILIELIKFSFPAMLSSLAGMLLIQIDRYIIGVLTDSREVGIYGLGYNICGLLNFFIISPYSLAFTVMCWKKLNDENAKRFYSKSVTYLFFAVVYSAIILSIFTPHLIQILSNKDYWLAKDVVPWISISMPFYGISIIGFFSFYVTKKTHLILMTYIFSLTVKVIFNFISIPFFGIYGAAFANFMAYVTLTISTYILSRKEYFFQYEWKKIVYMTAGAFALVFPFFYFDYEPTFLIIVLKFIALLFFPFALYLIKFYEPIELETIKRLTRKYILRKI